MKLKDDDKEILKSLAEGLTAKEIAPKIFKSVSWVHWRIAKLRMDHGAKNVTHLVAKLLVNL